MLTELFGTITELPAARRAAVGAVRSPPRPFLLNAIRKNRSKYLSMLKSSGMKVLTGEMSLDTALSQLGITAQGDVQQEITDLKDPPNSPVTIALKGSSNPLIDSGEMRAKVTWKVEP